MKTNDFPVTGVGVRVADRAAGVADPVKVVAGVADPVKVVAGLAGPATGGRVANNPGGSMSGATTSHFTRQLSRTEADIALRRFLELFYEEHGIEYTPEAFADFRREVSWKVGADFQNDSVLEDAIDALFNLDLVECCTHADLVEDSIDSNRQELNERFEDDFGTAINVALDEAHVAGEWIVRWGETLCAA